MDSVGTLGQVEKGFPSFCAEQEPHGLARGLMLLLFTPGPVLVVLTQVSYLRKEILA